jgi:ribosomal protein S18 acetylase RimI-like enzyme
MDNYSIAVEETSAANDLEQVKNSLMEFNALKGDLHQPRGLNVLIRDPDLKIQGGLIGYTSGKRLHVDMLWLDETIRYQGYGSKLIAMAEQAAIARGCTFAHLETSSFQAPKFYQKQGYEIFGRFQAPGEAFIIFYLNKSLV